MPRRSPVRQQAQRPTTKGGSPGPGLPTPARHYLQVTLRATRKAQPSAMAAPHSSSGRRAMRAARGRGLEAAAGPGPPHNDITPGRGGAGPACRTPGPGSCPPPARQPANPPPPRRAAPSRRTGGREGRGGCAFPPPRPQGTPPAQGIPPPRPPPMGGPSVPDRSARPPGSCSPLPTHTLFSHGLIKALTPSI